MVAGFPSDVSVLSFQASWQDGSDQGAFICHIFILGVLGMAIAGMDIITTLTFSNVTCYEAIPGSSMEVV